MDEEEYDVRMSKKSKYHMPNIKVSRYGKVENFHLRERNTFAPRHMTTSNPLARLWNCTIKPETEVSN